MPVLSFTRPLELPPDSTSAPERLGGKGAALVRLAAFGGRTPPGVGVTVEAFRGYLDSLGVRPEMEVLEVALAGPPLDRKALDRVAGTLLRGRVPGGLLEELAEAWQGWKAAGLAPAGVIVRSSATVEDSAARSYAGIFESLPVAEPPQLEETIRRVWASVFSPRAAAYYQASGLRRFPEMALVVQPFLRAERSGVMFTRFRAPDGEEKVLIEHVEGDCQKLVTGEVNPDRLWLARGASRADRDPLLGQFATELAETAQWLEGWLGMPQDVEWCIEGGHLYLLQARPITTSGERTGPAAGGGGEALLEGVGASSGQASGRAHLVFNIGDADALEAGSVLVTAMTNPDMVPAMRGSSAVVTDVGGMICHAAIVSRELGIPCVVGTGRATSTVHQGDPLTVDGDRGRVFGGLLQQGAAASPPRTLTWSGLWREWKRRVEGSEAVPLVSTAEALATLPEGLREALLAPLPDLALDRRLFGVGLDRLPEARRRDRFRRYLGRVAELAEEAGLERLGLVPLYLERHAADLAAAGAEAGGPLEVLSLEPSAEDAAGPIAAWGVEGRRYRILPEPSAEHLELRDGARPAVPLGAAWLAGAAAGSLRRQDEVPVGGVFGKVPDARPAPMPPPERRRRYHELLPELSAAHGGQVAGGDATHSWLDLRPEVPVTPLLKSMVLPGIETIPAALGFAELPPLHVQWILCRFHWRQDTFFALWTSLLEAAWREDFLFPLLERQRRVYRRLEAAAASLPQGDAELRAAPAAHLQDRFLAFWHAWVDFFAQSFFIQALGDDSQHAFLARAVEANLERLAGVDPAAGRLPGIAELTAPTTPVLTAEYLADLTRLRAALLEAGVEDLEAALGAVANGGHPALRAAYEEHHRNWHWMRERDPYFEPYDTPRAILAKALGLPEAPSADYHANLARARLALEVHFDLALARGDAPRLVYATGYGAWLAVEREDHHVVWLRASYPFRKLCLEWERRLAEVTPVEPRDVFFLEIPEILDAVADLPRPLPEELLARMRNRRAAYEAQLRLKRGGEAAVEPAREPDYY